VWNLRQSDRRRAGGWNRRHGKSLRPYRASDQQQRQDQLVQVIRHICHDWDDGSLAQLRHDENAIRTAMVIP